VTLFCGIDWAETQHDVAIITSDGTVTLVSVGDLGGSVGLAPRAFWRFRVGR
jgi:hypothetical protein